MVLGIKKENADDILAIFIAVLIFQSLPRFPFIGPYFEQYPFIVFGIAIILLIKRKDIINSISGWINEKNNIYHNGFIDV